MNADPSSSPRFRTKIEAASLVIAPLLMSIGDLMHPHESWDTRAQVAMIVAAPTRWYTAHLLLLVGMLLLVPGILLLSRTVAQRRSSLGYACRVLLLVSVGALSALFALEMLLGVFIGAADQGAAVALLDMFNSRVLVVLLPGLIAFFVGTGLFVRVLASSPGPLRGPALCFGLGALFILGEIISAQVLLSQIGNVLMFVAGVGFARVLGLGEGTPS